MNSTRKFALTALAAVCLYGGTTAARAAGQHNAVNVPRPHSATVGKCVADDTVEASLGKASVSMEQAKYQEAIETLQPLSSLNCDARVSLLLAAAFEGSGDLPKAEQTLQKAHSVWPSNNSIAASLARYYLTGKQVDKAVEALAQFHATSTTPMQEMDLAAVVFLAGHQLTAARTVAEVAYKTYPSVHSLLLLANALQLQGRFKEVIRLLDDQRQSYSQSPDFLITLAESEFDAWLYDTAKGDLEHAIALNHDSYQAHFLLGNVWFKTNDVNKAIAEYRIAVNLAPNQPRPYYQLALALEVNQDEAGEESVLQQALAVDSNYAPAHVEMGRILLSQNHPADAVVHLNLAIQENPSSEQAYFQLAKAYAQLGDKDKSHAIAKRLVAVRNANWRTAGDKNAGKPDANPEATP